MASWCWAVGAGAVVAELTSGTLPRSVSSSAPSWGRPTKSDRRRRNQCLPVSSLGEGAGAGAAAVGEGVAVWVLGILWLDCRSTRPPYRLPRMIQHLAGNHKVGRLLWATVLAQALV